MTSSAINRHQSNPEIRNRLLQAIPDFRGKKILVIGDIGLDEYLMGEVRRISPEAPVPILEVHKEDFRLGLAGNVAQNIKSLGGEPHLISVVGGKGAAPGSSVDSGGAALLKLLDQHQVSGAGLIQDPSRPTTRKARLMSTHHHLCRVDFETRSYISREIEDQILNRLRSLIPYMDIVILEDYAKGVISPLLIQEVIAICHREDRRVLVDPHVSNNGDFYKGVDLIKPNFQEALALSGLSESLDIGGGRAEVKPDDILKMGHTLQKKTGAHQIVMTQGKEGMTIFSGDRVTQVPTFARQVYDVTGAGDTVIASLALGLASNLSLEESCVLANYAAGVVVGQVGCVPCTVKELVDYIDSAPAEVMDSRI